MLESRVFFQYIKELKEGCESQLKYNYLNKHREDTSDFLRGKIIVLEELLAVPEALKRSASNARDAVLNLSQQASAMPSDKEDKSAQRDEMKVRL